MARLVYWPNGLRTNFREPLSGPRAIGAGSGETMGGFIQTVASPFGSWRWRFGFPRMRGQLFRRYRGWIASQHGGANATTVPFCDWDGLTRAQMGISVSLAEWLRGNPWDNYEPWANGMNWASSPPVVAVVDNAALGATQIRLANEYWGHNLGVGDWLGFLPNHFGLYTITEVIADGSYRIWPALRKAVAITDYATLQPTMAMRMESEDAGTAARGAAFSENASITLVEVFDYDVASFFND